VSQYISIFMHLLLFIFYNVQTLKNTHKNQRKYHISHQNIISL